MKKLEVKTRVSGNKPQFKKNLNSVVTFMRHDEDRIEVVDGELIYVDVYKNGELIFSGDKSEFFKKLID
jgi:hypothetical protein